ncbi:hypothetical protein J7337_005859 [Fusarium musae]|uniref:Uncharacterized protein n=1 Tax=Fusarium musae TaxID=1042133 RepID=A0A9P8DJR8_9HYPO|nr:hypothetical protein J7337_005859 [Fusarium musae]KAG9503022.1 hypothetical protein J7337_005859 [Fusarium musae]
MAPNKNNNKNDQPEVLGAVSKGSIRFNSRAASLPEKRGQSLVAEQSSFAKKSKVEMMWSFMTKASEGEEKKINEGEGETQCGSWGH